MTNWEPLTNIWDEYTIQLDSVQEAELTEDIVYPPVLFMGDEEKQDIQKFVMDRVEEMTEEARARNGVNLQWIGAFLFKSLITGMVWERERVGK
jgi:hypothetical protein